MNKKLIFLFFAFVIFLFNGIVLEQAHAQIPTYVPNVIPPSPNAAALTKFSDVPVSPYTGTADISIPFYTIQAKGITVPISLAYHTGGIRLAEEASSEGLGWVLQASGEISKTINDKDDFGGGYTTAIPQPMGDLKEYQPANGAYGSLGSQCYGCNINIDKYLFDFNCSYNVHFYTNGADSVSDYFNQFNPSPETAYDQEPDNYSFNFLGHSGKFIITRTGKVIMEKQDNLRIQLVNSAGQVSFIITDEKGNRFRFSDTEQGGLASSPDKIMSWHLSQITTQQGDVVTFNYQTMGTNQVGSLATQTYTIDCSTGTFASATNTGYLYYNVVLSSIDYTNGQVQFTFDNSRTDLNGGVKLDKIAIYSKKGVTGNGLTYLKEFDFGYGYFNPGTNYELERLRLDNITEKSGAAALTPYSFIYNSGPGAGTGEKHGYGIDHWGYYNGEPNTQLIPTMNTSYLHGGSTFYTNYTGANRDPSPANMNIFTLQKITYPTGGYSVINYEANTYDYYRSQYTGQIAENPYLTVTDLDTTIQLENTSFTGGNASGTFDFSKIYPLLPVGSLSTNAVMSVAFKASGSSPWPDTLRNRPGGLVFTCGSDATDLSNPALTCSGPVCSRVINLSITAGATTIPWTAHWDATKIPAVAFSEIDVHVTYQGFTPYVNNNPTLTAGGLRVKSIIDYTAGGTAAKERIWDYTFGSTGQYTNGILMVQPSYSHYEFTPNGSNAACLSFILFGSSNTNLTSTIGGNIVGYSHVTEYTVDPSNSANNGKVVYNFINTPDSTIFYNGLRMPGIPNMGNNLDGSLLSKITYKNSSGAYFKVAETDNTYHTANRMVFYSAKYRSSQVHDNTSGDCPTPPYASVENQSVAMFFPSIKSERVLMDTTKNFVYDPADTTKYQKTVSVNYYDNPIHYLQTRTKTTDSKGDTIISKVTYPQDYIPTGATKTSNAILDSLIGQNMVAETIEQSGILYHNATSTALVTSATENRYKQLFTGPMALDSIYRLDIINPVTNFVPMSISGNTYSHDSRYRTLIAFDKYDTTSNITQYTQYKQLPTSIIWDYRHMSPIAQVKNGAQADVAYTSFEANGTGNWTVTSHARDSTTAAITGNKSYNVANGLSKAGLTAATTYVVSYWTKSSTALGITGTITGYPVKGPTINGWTYYEHLVTGQTTITITGTGNIDEVRLYPQNAEMTSYTYNPGIGVSTINDARAGIHYYEYDNFLRLMNIKDQNGNIIKSFDYNYAH